MMIWLTLLPFSLWGTCGWTTVPLAFIIAFLLLGEPWVMCFCCLMSLAAPGLLLD
jgi:hypothetical protein